MLYFSHLAWWRLPKGLVYYVRSAEGMEMYIECDKGFFPRVKDPFVARSVCHSHPLLCSWIASLPSACFSFLLSVLVPILCGFERNRRRMSPWVMASLARSHTILSWTGNWLTLKLCHSNFAYWLCGGCVSGWFVCVCVCVMFAHTGVRRVCVCRGKLAALTLCRWMQGLLWSELLECWHCQYATSPTHG